MKAVLFDQPGDASVLYVGETDEPVRKSGEVLIEITATAVNRADVMQRMGFYPPPPGVSDIPGLEVSGYIAEVVAILTLGQGRARRRLTGHHFRRRAMAQIATQEGERQTG